MILCNCRASVPLKLAETVLRKISVNLMNNGRGTTKIHSFGIKFYIPCHHANVAFIERKEISGIKFAC